MTDTNPKHEVQVLSTPGGSKLPTAMRQGDAGLDLASTAKSAINIPPGGTALVPTGLKVAIPDGMAGLVCSRSGLALKNQVFVLNSPGVIDSNYRGEIGVILQNLGKKLFTVLPEARVAQLLFVKLPDVELVEVEELSETNRGTEGFGSSGL